MKSTVLTHIPLEERAIKAALDKNWNQAIDLNKQILGENPNDIDSLNRLSKAYLETGNLKEAKKINQRAIEIEPYDKIALKISEKIKYTRKGDLEKNNEIISFDGKLFLEEPGKTKIVKLINTGGKKLISQLNSGDDVAMSYHSHRVSVNTLSGKYIGKLPDDIAAHLKKLIRFGNKYQARIKSVNEDGVRVFISEEFRAEKVKNIMSFPVEKINYVAFTPPELVHKKDTQGDFNEGEEEI